jgi:hypothetical protein
MFRNYDWEEMLSKITKVVASSENFLSIQKNYCLKKMLLKYVAAGSIINTLPYNRCRPKWRIL